MKQDKAFEALLEEIRNADNETLMNGKDSNGVSFLSHIFNLHLKLFGTTCSFCPGKIPGYIQKIKTYNTMKNANKPLGKYILQPGVMIPVPGTSDSFSAANITDEKAIELLSININRKALFLSMPKTVDEDIKAYKENLFKVVKSEDLVSIGELKFSIQEAVEMLAEVGVNTRSETVAGVEKKIAALKAEDLEKLSNIAQERLNSKEVVLHALEEEDSIETLQFRMDQALQDFEEIEEEGEEKEAAKQAFENAKVAFDAAQK